ncbi:hypothetical protein [Azospirillum lipoferum]|uniref:REase AHJR-like domain-containing protein n=1 Tax=Azospirillum lipoferum (strain 4B) TaxID=862719 RepID=G7ZG60_AZOL4|nr:hypothetical protein [Azospirillum lipoferum]CBS90763.1 conserved protein of unknown function [Azospirillum lipoferum 4B]
MSMPAHAWSEETEAEFLEGLRARYEAEGYTFTIAPESSLLPPFLGSYIPDALARKPGQNIAIEVKRHPTRPADWQLQDIRRLFDGHPDWQLSVVHRAAASGQAVVVPTAPPAAIRRRLEETRALSALGHRRPAFVMAWALLEAAVQLVGEAERKPNSAHTPGSLIQTLAMNGYIAPATERRMRELTGLRNRIVHGDIEAEPAFGDVEAILSAVEEVLDTNAT